MTALEALIAARELISAPERWTQNAYARDRTGRPVLATGNRAVCWCGDGALYRVTYPCHATYAWAIRALARRVGTEFPLFQDVPRRTHAEVLAVFDAAIEAERAEGAQEGDL